MKYSELVSLFNVANKNNKLMNFMVAEMSDPSVSKLIGLLNNSSILSEDEVIEHLFVKNKPSNYSKLKRKVIDLLLNCISQQTIPWEELESKLNQFNIINKNTISIIHLLNLHDYKLSIKLAEAELLRAIRYELTVSVVNLLKIIVSYYGITYYNKYKLIKYQKLLNKYYNIQNWENKCELYFINFQNKNFETLAKPDSIVLKRLKACIDELDKADVTTFYFRINKYRINVIYYEYMKDYNQIIKLSNAVITESDRTVLTKNRVANVNVRKAWAYIQAGSYDEAINIIEETSAYVSPTAVIQFILGFYRVKAMIYSSKYSDAMKWLNLIMKNPKYKSISNVYQELFDLQLGYMHIINNAHFENSGNSIAQFRVHKFLNEIPNFSKDKRGINVAVLLLHITILLQRKEYSNIIDRVDALKFYAYRHLRRDDSYRTNCMIKMVLQMAKADFNLIRTERYTADLYKQLQEVKLAGSGQNIETEIIPYEMLWDIMKRALR